MLLKTIRIIKKVNRNKFEKVKKGHNCDRPIKYCQISFERLSYLDEREFKTERHEKKAYSKKNKR